MVLAKVADRVCVPVHGVCPQSLGQRVDFECRACVSTVGVTVDVTVDVRKRGDLAQWTLETLMGGKFGSL